MPLFGTITADQNDFIEHWAYELGNYPQQKGALHKNYGHQPEGYCCLGVACKMDGLEEHLPEDGLGKFFFPGEEPDEFSVPDGWWVEKTGLPLQVRNWLVQLNDSGATFNTIARFLMGLSASYEVYG